jgi:DNA-binding HxlR family transcriptional regulator
VFLTKATYLSSMSDDDRSAGSTSDHTGWQRVWHHLYGSLGSKWTFHVLRLLSEGDAGFNEMKRELDGVTAKTLSQRLAELRCRGFVERHVEATTPPTTRYTLTTQGEQFVSTLRELESLVEVVECGDCGEDECAVAVGEEPDSDALALCC